jgi:predicted GIY-YIG superfamily endonuclease
MSWKVYVIHFDKPYKHAKHYTGIAKNVEKRMKLHRSGNGSKLMAVLNRNNIGFKYNIIAEYDGYSEAKTHEKHLKTKVKKPQRHCPICLENKE